MPLIGTPHKQWKQSHFALLKLNKGNPEVVLMNSPLLSWFNYLQIIVGIESQTEKMLAHYYNTNDQCKQILSDQISA